MLLFSTLLHIDESLTREKFINLVIEWNRSSSHTENIIDGLQWNGESNIRYGSDARWLDIKEYRKGGIVAVRYEKKQENGVIWDTDYVMNFSEMVMAVRLDRSYTPDALETGGEFSTPHFITLLVEGGYLKADGNLEVLKTPVEIDRSNADILASVVAGKSGYRLPVVYVSKTVYQKDPVDVSFLASRLKGVAHVLVQYDGWSSSAIRQACGDRNEYNGAIGIYFPNRSWKHRRYFYRSAVGYDDFLFKKVVRSVIEYSNSLKIDTLFTWQGVANAMLGDRLENQRIRREEAEKARASAEARLVQSNDTLEEKDRKFREYVETTKKDMDLLLDDADSEILENQQQIEALTGKIKALEAENYGLRSKLDSQDAVPLIFAGSEYEFYPGEIKDMVLCVLSKADIPSGTRRGDIIRDVIEHNGYEHLSEKRAETVKQLLKNYDGMSKQTRQTLQNLGFEIVDDGKHYKVIYYGDDRYLVTYSKTPSDHRTGKNSAQKTIQKAF